MSPRLLKRSPDVVLLLPRLFYLRLGIRQLASELRHFSFAAFDLTIRLLNLGRQRRYRLVCRLGRQRFPLCLVLLRTLLKLGQHLLQISNPALLNLCRLTGFTRSFVKAIPILRPLLHRGVRCG